MKRFLFSLLAVISFQAAGVGFVSNAEAASYFMSDQCYLPGPNNNSTNCTIYWGWSGNPANNVLCLWTTTNTLYACQATTAWSQRYEWISSPSVSLEIRHHTSWPGNDPSWPNLALVRSHGTLVYSKTVSGVTSSVPNGTCTTTISSGTSIATTVAGASTSAVICLNSGTFNETATISPKSGQIIKSTSAGSPATIYNASGNPSSDTIYINASNVTIRDLNITGPTTSRVASHVFTSTTSGIHLYNLQISYSITPIATDSSSDVEINAVSITNPGDGSACSGCANPAIWTNSSNNVRIVASSATGNGVGPEGDGEIACYNTTNYLVQDTTSTNSGAAGLYIVSCDNSLILNNTITGAQEWGLDIVDTGFSTGTDYSLFDHNTVTFSGNGGGVIDNSTYDVFSSNTFSTNRQRSGGSGSCDGLNVRGTSFTGLEYFPNVILNDAGSNNSEPDCND